MKSCFVILYYGKFPVWFPLFLKSCEYNSEVNWLIVTDNPYSNKIPSNIKFVNLSLKNLNQIVNRKLNCDVTLNPKKLPDYKPMCGFLFSEYLVDYDYWGWCDIDLIFGDIKKYMETYMGTYDCVSFAEEPNAFPYGACTIIRNNKKMNELFKQSKDLDYVLESIECLQFDEDWTGKIESIGHVMKNSKINFLRVTTGQDDSRLKLGNPRPKRNRVGVKKRWKLLWTEGKLYRGKTELMFFHFFRTKHGINESFNFEEVCVYDKILLTNKRVKALHE